MSHEIYPNAPIVLVACEIRHPSAPELSPREIRAFRAAFRERLPLFKPVESQTLEIVNGVPRSPVRETSPRFVSRDRTRAVTVARERVVIETTAYVGFDDLRASIEDAMNAVVEIRLPDGIERIGLRYIDEVRVPAGSDGGADWSEWVDQDVLGPSGRAEELGMKARDWQGLARFDAGKSHTLVVRYGPRTGFAVNPGEPLRRHPTEAAPGPFFLLDFDSFWESADDVPEFTTDGVVHRCDALHAPIRGLFETLITDRLRDEVLRHHG